MPAAPGVLLPDAANPVICLLSPAIRWVMLLAAFSAVPFPGLQQRTASEQDVKAAFLYNFTRFVTWPSGIPPGSEPFRVCIAADARTTESVERTMAGEKVNGRAAETLVPRTADDVKKCQLFFVGREAEERAKPLLTAARDLPVLVVGDGEEFPRRGGAIGFVVEDGKVKFDIYSQNAERIGLTISSRLLSVARKTDIRR